MGCDYHGLCSRYPGSVARFKMLNHPKVIENPQLREMDQKSKSHKLDDDGIKSVRYQLIDIKLQPLFTQISVKLPPPPPPRQRGWLESLSENIQETQNKIVNSVLEKINEVTEELTRDEEELSAVKIYY